MEKHITKSLAKIGYKNYILTKSGKLYKTTPTKKEIKKDNLNRFYLINDTGQGKKVALKKIYKKIYDIEFCYDNIQNQQGEEWKQIKGTNGRYLISNCGRVKSLCGYNAKIL